MKKRVLAVSLSLLVCLCCCFSGFGSVKAYAFTIPINSVVVHPDFGVNEQFFFVNSDGSSVFVDCVYDPGEFATEFNLASTSTNVSRMGFMLNSTDFTYSYNHDAYDYYIAYNVFFKNQSVFDVDSMTVRYKNYLGNYVSLNLLSVNSGNTDLQNQSTYNCSISAIGKLPVEIGQHSINQINLYGNGSVTSGSYNEFTCYLYQVPKGTDVETVNSLISAINNQTGALQGSIGQAADDVQQSIEDQYQMEDEEDFGFSDIQQQYEEKMGVLTFGTETTIQMLELFSPSNAGEAYIRVPGWTMEVQGETYQIWDEYVFYFDSIEENFPFLVTTMRTFTVAMFYVAIVGYINKVYERNFLAK